MLLLWNLVKSAFSSDEEEMTLKLFQKNPDKMQEMIIETLQEKLAADPALAQKLADPIDRPGPDGTSTGAQIMNASIAGIVDLRGADLSHAQGLDITAVKIGDTRPKPDKPGKKA